MRGSLTRLQFGAQHTWSATASSMIAADKHRMAPKDNLSLLSMLLTIVPSKRRGSVAHVVTIAQHSCPKRLPASGPAAGICAHPTLFSVPPKLNLRAGSILSLELVQQTRPLPLTSAPTPTSPRDPATGPTL